LTADTTLAEFRSAYFKSGFFENLRLDTWQDRGRPRAVDRLRQHTQRLLDDLKAPKGSAEIVARGEAFIGTLAQDRSADR
jgi:trimethylamine:corrinoid methyltransferase-like protein